MPAAAAGKLAGMWVGLWESMAHAHTTNTHRRMFLHFSSEIKRDASEILCTPRCLVFPPCHL